MKEHLADVNKICEVANELTPNEKERILLAIFVSTFGKEETEDTKQIIKQFEDIAAFFKIQNWIERIRVEE